MLFDPRSIELFRMAGSLRALSRDPEHAVGFLTRYAERLLFARDFYGGDLPDFLKGLRLSDAVREKIMFRNAQTLLACVIDSFP